MAACGHDGPSSGQEIMIGAPDRKIPRCAVRNMVGQQAVLRGQIMR